MCNYILLILFTFHHSKVTTISAKQISKSVKNATISQWIYIRWLIPLKNKVSTFDRENNVGFFQLHSSEASSCSPGICLQIFLLHINLLTLAPDTKIYSLENCFNEFTKCSSFLNRHSHVYHRLRIKNHRLASSIYAVRKREGYEIHVIGLLFHHASASLRALSSTVHQKTCENYSSITFWIQRSLTGLQKKSTHCI